MQGPLLLLVRGLPLLATEVGSRHHTGGTGHGVGPDRAQATADPHRRTSQPARGDTWSTCTLGRGVQACRSLWELCLLTTR